MARLATGKLSERAFVLQDLYYPVEGKKPYEAALEQAAKLLPEQIDQMFMFMEQKAKNQDPAYIVLLEKMREIKSSYDIRGVLASGTEPTKHKPESKVSLTATREADRPAPGRGRARKQGPTSEYN